MPFVVYVFKIRKRKQKESTIYTDRDKIRRRIRIMFTLIFFILFIMIFGKIIIFGVKAAWGIGKLLFSVVLLPLIILALFFAGLIYVAFIALVIVGMIALIKCIVD